METISRSGELEKKLKAAELKLKVYDKLIEITNRELDQNIVGRQLFLPLQDSKIGKELHHITASALADLYSVGQITVSAAPGNFAYVPIRYGNLGGSTISTVTLRVTLPLSLTYADNSAHLSPTVSGNSLVWQVLGARFLDEHSFSLRVRTPNAALGLSYPVTISVSASSNEERLDNNVFVSAVMLATMTFMPIAMR